MNKIETPEEQDTRSRTTADKIRKENPTFLISSLLILTLIGIFVFVMYSYKDQKERLTESVQNNISTITDLKALQIEGWRKERLDNGLMISADKLISDKVRSYQGKKNEEYNKDISDWLKTITQNTNYKAAYILDVNGNSILSEPANTGRPGEQLLKYTNKAIEEKKTILSDFHFYENSDTAQLALVIPLVTSKDNDVGEVLLLEIDPNTVFYPMIKTWSPGSNTAECLLVKKDGEDILYLNKPRNSEYSASKFKVNLKEEELLSVKAFKGITGITTGIDYNHKSVIGVIKPVPGTEWFIIASIEKDELYAQVKQVTVYLVILISLLIMIIGSIILYLWDRQKISHYKRLYVSELKREALVKHFEFVVKYANDIIILTDKTGQLLEANERAVSVYGYTIEELLKLNIRDLRPRDLRDEVEATYNKIHEEGGLLFETRHLKKDGSEIPVEVSSREIIIDGYPFYHGIIRDISERKRAQEEMKKAKDKAEEMNKLKSSFLANMSHELRTPMSGILGFAEILYSELDDTGFKEMAGIILNGGKRLTKTLNSILDLSKVEADKMELKLECADLSGLIKESVSLFYASAKEKGLLLETELENNVYSNIDMRIFDHALSNLIQNAIVYTEKGKITVELKREVMNDKEYAVIRVIDTGIGIPENHLGAIFEPFRQVSDGLARSYEGTGLGLSLTKKFVEIMNGNISVQSQFGKGSTFTVRFAALSQTENEVNTSKQEINNVKAAKNPGDKKILVVEDDDLTLTTVRAILKNRCAIDSVMTGYDAIEMAKKNKYDIILMDIGLKGMSGLEAAQKIKKIPGYEKTPIVAVTAYAMVGDKEKFLEGGCTHYISKPFKINEFIETILNLP